MTLGGDTVCRCLVTVLLTVLSVGTGVDESLKGHHLPLTHLLKLCLSYPQVSSRAGKPRKVLR